MRYSIAIVLVAFTLAGCAESKREAALQVWHSPDATLEQRAHAVLVLVPKGADLETVMSLLGTNGGWAHFYGPTIDAEHTPPRQLPDTDIWCFHYKLFPAEECSYTSIRRRHLETDLFAPTSADAFYYSSHK